MRFFHYTNVGLGVLFSLAISHCEGLPAQHIDEATPLVGLEIRQAPAIIATNEFLRRGNQASTVAGDFLYIDGGDFSFINNGTPVNEYCKLSRHSKTFLDIDSLHQHQPCSLSTSRKIGRIHRSPYAPSSSPAAFLPLPKAHSGFMKQRTYYIPASPGNHRNLIRALRYLPRQYGHSSQTGLGVEHGHKRSSLTRQVWNQYLSLSGPSWRTGRTTPGL